MTDKQKNLMVVYMFKFKQLSTQDRKTVVSQLPTNYLKWLAANLTKNKLALTNKEVSTVVEVIKPFESTFVKDMNVGFKKNKSSTYYPLGYDSDGFMHDTPDDYSYDDWDLQLCGQS